MAQFKTTTELTEKVSINNTADAVGNKNVFVYATPFLVALIERTCIKLMQDFLHDNEVSVGTNINLDHLAPSPIGHEIRCIAKLVEQNKRKYVFDVTAYDEDKIIGKSTHTRYIVDLEKFTNKL